MTTTAPPPGNGTPSSPRTVSLQLTILSILVAVLPILALGTLIAVFHDTAYREKSIALLSQRVLRNAQSLDAFLREKLSNLEQEASAPIADLSRSSHLRDRLHALQTTYPDVYLGLEFLDAQGRVVAYAGQSEPHADHARKDWFPRALNRPSLIIDQPAAPEDAFFATIRVTNGREVWVLRAQLDPRQLEIRMRAFHPGGTGGAFLLGANGKTRSVPNDAATLPAATMATLGQQIFPESRPVVLEAPGTDGSTNFYACAPLTTTADILVFHQPRKAVLGPLHTARAVAAAITILGIAAIVGTILAMSRRMEQRLRKAEALQQHMQQQLIEAGKLAAIGEMAAGIAHEINNPLAIMMENAGWIQDLIKSDDAQSEDTMAEIRDSLQTIATQGHRCKEITHKLLSFARKTDNSLRVVQINALLEDIAGFARQKAKYSGVTIQVSLDPAVPEISASATEVQQVVLNLVNNAIDAIDRDNGLVRISSRRDGDWVVIDVADNGAGISDEHRTRIFEPFFTTKPVGKGTGLGLSICRDIVANMGGSISLESAPGRGSTFHVRLPVSLAT